jgi:hypothetical protein
MIQQKSAFTYSSWLVVPLLMILSCSGSDDFPKPIFKNIFERKVLNSRFVIGSYTEMGDVGYRLDHGAVLTASGTTDWRAALPPTWPIGSLHTIEVGHVSGESLDNSEQLSFYVGAEKYDLSQSGRAYIFYSTGTSGIATQRADAVIGASQTTFNRSNRATGIPATEVRSFECPHDVLEHLLSRRGCPLPGKCPIRSRP